MSILTYNSPTTTSPETKATAATLCYYFNTSARDIDSG